MKYIRPVFFIQFFIISFIGAAQRGESQPLAIVKNDLGYNIINRNGKLYLDNFYEDLTEISENFVHACTKTNEGFIHIPTKTFIAYYKWNKGTPIKGTDSLAVFDYTYLTQSVSENGDTVFKASKTKPANTSDFVAIDSLTRYNYTFINNISAAWINTESILLIERKGYWRVVDKQGNFLLADTINYAEKVSEDFMLLANNKRAFFLNTKTQKIVKMKFDAARSFSEGMACIGYGDSALSLKDGLAFYKPARYGFINKDKKIVIQPQYKLAGSFFNNRAFIKKSEKYGFINKKGELIISTKFERASNFSEGYASVMHNEKWGVINTAGKWTAYPKFDRIYNFSFGLAPAKLGDKYGYIDTTGTWIVKPQYKVGRRFTNPKSKNCLDCLQRFSNCLIFEGDVNE